MSTNKWSLSNLSLNARVMVVVIAVVTGLALLTVINAFQSRSIQMDLLSVRLKAQIETAISVANSFHERAQSGEFSEAEAEGMALGQIQDMQWDDGEGYIFVYGTDMVMRMHPLRPEWVGEDISGKTDFKGMPHYRIMSETNQKEGHTILRYTQAMPDGTGKDKISYSELYEPWNLNFTTGAYFDDVDARFWRNLATSLLQSALVGFLVILLVWFIMRSIRRTIGGEPALALIMLNRMAEGELSLKGSENTNAIPGSMMAAMKQLHLKLIDVVGHVQQGSDTVSGAAEEIAKGNDDLSQRTQEQASSLEETAASMEEMTSTVRQNAENASHANQLANGAREQAERGGQVAREAVVAMSEITASSKKIADIVGLIDEIAFQTNLLSLNAAVEAARAGEQGRGFAVVASEVRNLSQRSAEAAKEIKQLINEAVDRIEAGSALVDESGEALAEIVESVKKVTDIVGEIAAASHEQSAGIDQVNRAVMQMDQVTQQNAALVEEAAAAAREMQDQSAELRRQIQFFRLDGRSHNAAAVAVRTTPVSSPKKLATKSPVRSTPPVASRKATTTSSPTPPRKAAPPRDEGSEWTEF